MKKQVESLQSLDLNNLEIKIFEPKTKSIEDVFLKVQQNQGTINELKKYYLN